MYNMYNNSYGCNSTIHDDCSVLMTPPQLAEYLGIGRNLAYQLLNEGIINGFKIGNQWKVSKQAVDLYIAKKSHLV